MKKETKATLIAEVERLVIANARLVEDLNALGQLVPRRALEMSFRCGTITENEWNEADAILSGHRRGS